MIMFVIETALGRWSGLLIGGEFDPLAKVSEGMVQDVPEWPLTLSTYARVALYVLLPVVAWSFGIVAEEIFARVFI